MSGERGVPAADEGTPRFAVGDRVRIAARRVAHHVRTPAYAQGRCGTVERILGRFRNPESLAHGGDGQPLRMLYRVRLRQHDLWPDYGGDAHDTLELEIYEHWLEPV